MVAQLRSERRLDHPPGELGQQPARPSDLVCVEPLQRVLELLLRQ